jgi:hypothetical protein
LPLKRGELGSDASAERSQFIQPSNKRKQLSERRYSGLGRFRDAGKRDAACSPSKTFPLAVS